VKIANFLALWHPTLEPRVSLCRQFLTDSSLWVPHGEDPVNPGWLLAARESDTGSFQSLRMTLKRNDIVCTTKRHAY
jgi:hypothetical protein